MFLLIPAGLLPWTARLADYFREIRHSDIKICQIFREKKADMENGAINNLDKKLIIRCIFYSASSRLTGLAQELIFSR